MKTLRILIFAIMTTVMVFPVAPQTASAAAASPSPVASVQDAQAKLADLNNQVEQGQGKLDELDRQLTSARKQEEAVNGQVSELARLQYEQPMMSISMVMGALTLDQLLGDIAQSRLVAHKQSDLLGEARSLADQDQKTRDQQSKQLDGIKSARDQAAQMIQQFVGYSPLVDQARATAGFDPPGGGHFRNTFAYGYCTAYVASRRNITFSGNAVEWWANARLAGYAEGLKPQPGAVGVYDNLPYGHVVYIESVNPDGSYVVSEMNYKAWDVVDTRTVKANDPTLMGFIY